MQNHAHREYTHLMYEQSLATEAVIVFLALLKFALIWSSCGPERTAIVGAHPQVPGMDRVHSDRKHHKIVIRFQRSVRYFRKWKFLICRQKKKLGTFLIEDCENTLAQYLSHTGINVLLHHRTCVDQKHPRTRGVCANSTSYIE